MAVQVFNNTSVDTIAVWTPTFAPYALIPKPVLLSTGTGIDSFINIDQAPINTVVRPTINNALYRQTKQVVVTGTLTFNASSTALSALRDVTNYQADSHTSVPGLMLIINRGALLVDTFKEWYWTSPYVGPNRGKILSDVTMTFSARPPTAISLGGLLTVPSVASVLNGFGIF